MEALGLNFADWFILVVLVASGLISFSRGFTKEFLSLFLWVAAFIAAISLEYLATPKINEYIGNPEISKILSYVVVFIVFIFIGGILIKFIRYADFAPMGHSVRVRREEEKGTISWKIKFRNGTEKNFVSPITTKPWGKFIPKLAEGDKPNQGEINSQRLYTEPEGLNIDGELPRVPKESFKKGVYY